MPRRHHRSRRLPSRQIDERGAHLDPRHDQPGRPVLRRHHHRRQHRQRGQPQRQRQPGRAVGHLRSAGHRSHQLLSLQPAGAPIWRLGPRMVQRPVPAVVLVAEPGLPAADPGRELVGADDHRHLDQHRGRRTRNHVRATGPRLARSVLRQHRHDPGLGLVHAGRRRRLRRHQRLLRHPVASAPFGDPELRRFRLEQDPRRHGLAGQPDPGQHPARQRRRHHRRRPHPACQRRVQHLDRTNRERDLRAARRQLPRRDQPTSGRHRRQYLRHHRHLPHRHHAEQRTRRLVHAGRHRPARHRGDAEHADAGLQQLRPVAEHRPDRDQCRPRRHRRRRRLHRGRDPSGGLDRRHPAGQLRRQRRQ